MAKRINPKFVQCKQPLGTKAKYPAILLRQNGKSIFLVSLPIYDLFPFCFVSRRIEDHIEGFQRTLNPDRAVDIANYMDEQMGSIPTSIVLSAQEDSQFKFDPNTNNITFKRKENSFLVIDGQHRLYGYGTTKKEHNVPAAIYIGLSRSDEAAIFIDINTNQKGVPAALLLDIKQIADKETSKEAKLRYLFDKLNEDNDSVLCGLLSPSENKIGKISRVTFNRAFNNFFDSSTINRLSEETQYILLKNYFIALELSIPGSEELITKSVYFEAFADVFNEVLNLAYTKRRNYKFETLKEILEPLKNADLKNLAVGGKARLTKGTITPHIKNALANVIQISDDLV